MKQPTGINDMTKTVKPIGSVEARTQVDQMTERAMTYKGAHKLTPTEAAKVLGLGVNDVRNIRQGNARLSMPMIIKMMRVGGFSARSIFNGPRPKLALKRGRPTQVAIDKRIRKYAWDWTGKDLAEATGLSVTGAYGLRYATKAHVTLYTVIGFVNAGYTLDDIILGKK